MDVPAHIRFQPCERCRIAVCCDAGYAVLAKGINHGAGKAAGTASNQCGQWSRCHGKAVLEVKKINACSRGADTVQAG